MNILKWLLDDVGAENPRYRAKKSAATAFLTLHPGEHVRWTEVIAEEADRYIAKVDYGNWDPPYFELFAVEKATMQVEVLGPDSAYWPRGLR